MINTLPKWSTVALHPSGLLPKTASHAEVKAAITALERIAADREPLYRITFDLDYYRMRLKMNPCAPVQVEAEVASACDAILKEALNIEPRLCFYGIGLYDGDYLVYKGRKFDESLSRLKSSTQQLVDCAEWLTMQCRTKSVTRHYSSYKLKHIVEHAYGRYISNGALCAIAIGLGFKYKVLGPNIIINISKKLFNYDGTPVA